MWGLLAGGILPGSRYLCSFITFGANPEYIIGCHHILKVLGNKVLPLVCLVAILVYWMLGIALPSPDSNLLDDNVSNCTLPL